MLVAPLIVLASFAYVGLLFAIAHWGDRRADAGRSIIGNPYIYTLSLAVYCTSWTFYGSVGRAVTNGIGFLPIYLGPTLMAALWWTVLARMIRISKAQRITSIADFVASRYGKSQLLGGLVTIIAVVGVVPYIALQLKAISASFSIMMRYPELTMPDKVATPLFIGDNTFYIAMLLATFAILFGTRHLDATERHEGLVAAVAFESVVKLCAFVAVGLFVTYGMFDGFGDIFGRAAELPQAAGLLMLGGESGDYVSWTGLMILSSLAILFLPRQFQVGVVENVDPSHINKAVWLFPLYLFIINIFVLPIALGGMLRFPDGSVDADTFVLSLPIAEKAPWLAMLVFIGGLSAATGMVIVETIALSTMICNDLVMPALLRMRWLRLTERTDLSNLLRVIRRGAIILVMTLGYLYFLLAGEAYALVAIGLISFTAVAQFAPAILGGIFWKGGTRLGAIAGLSAGFLIWLYTLLLPSFAKSGWLPITFLSEGIFGFDMLKPQQLFGLMGLDPITHCLFWSMLANTGIYVVLSLLREPSAAEHSQAILFVDAQKHASPSSGSRFWRGSATVDDLSHLLRRFLGPERAREALQEHARRRGLSHAASLQADAVLVHDCERLLAGAIGSASARAMIASVVEEEPLGIDEVMSIIDEATQVLAYSRQLEQKSRELEVATSELRSANDRLRELDRLKDDFISTVSHEFRTPLTSIRAFTEILSTHTNLDAAQREKFLSIIVRESERLTRLINHILDLSKIESGEAEWQLETLDLPEVVDEAILPLSQVYENRDISLIVEAAPGIPAVLGDRDRLIQVIQNLLSNAAKFVPTHSGRVTVSMRLANDAVQVDVTDNGPGIAPEYHEAIFGKFRQVGDALVAKPEGTGLGLPICRQIVSRLGGRLWVQSSLGAGACFSFTVPLAPETAAAGRAAELNA